MRLDPKSLIDALVVRIVDAVAGALNSLLEAGAEPQDVGDTDQNCFHGRCRHWETSTEDGGHNVHVVPLGDLVDHTKDDECVCGPKSEAITADDGTYSWLHTHHSLDARETTE